MNWKPVILGLALTLLPIALSAQANILNARTPNEVGVKTASQLAADNDKPLSYGYVDDRDILWSKKVWEIVDLNERVNFPLLYPTDRMSTDRKSLFHTLLDAIESGEIENVYETDTFKDKVNWTQLQEAMTKVDTSEVGYEQRDLGEAISEENIIRRKTTGADIVEYRIMGLWYFDKRQGELKYRILGLAPVALDVNLKDDPEVDPNNIKTVLFWVWYRDARQVLHNAKVFNERNSAQPISFDMLLNARRFNGIIYKEDNVQGDQPINQYITDNALFQLLEANRIKESIRDREQDMWAY